MTDPNLIEIARLDKLVAELRLARDELADIAEEAFKLAKPKADVKYGTCVGGMVLERIKTLRG